MSVAGGYCRHDEIPNLNRNAGDTFSTVVASILRDFVVLIRYGAGLIIYDPAVPAQSLPRLFFKRISIA